jgi:hypothetical protein
LGRQQPRRARRRAVQAQSGLRARVLRQCGVLAAGC